MALAQSLKVIAAWILFTEVLLSEVTEVVAR